MNDNGVMRVSSTGANRNSADGKIRYVGAISPLVTKRYGGYIESHSLLPDGTRRSNGNWQNLFGETTREHQEVCAESLYRHMIDFLLEHDGYASTDGLEAALGGMMFNLQAYWFSVIIEEIKEKESEKTYIDKLTDTTSEYITPTLAKGGKITNEKLMLWGHSAPECVVPFGDIHLPKPPVEELVDFLEEDLIKEDLREELYTLIDELIEKKFPTEGDE